MDRPWDLGILELLKQHHSMPSTPQGQSPAEKFLGRHTCMSFKLASLTSDEEGNAHMQANMHINMHMLKQLEEHSQDTTTVNCGSVLLSGKSRC